MTAPCLPVQSHLLCQLYPHLSDVWNYSLSDWLLPSLFSVRTEFTLCMNELEMRATQPSVFNKRASCTLYRPEDHTTFVAMNYIDSPVTNHMFLNTNFHYQFALSIRVDKYHWVTRSVRVDTNGRSVCIIQMTMCAERIIPCIRTSIVKHCGSTHSSHWTGL
jgi:hypothetical protein